MKAKIERIIFERRIDENTDISHIGEWTDTRKPGALLAGNGRAVRDIDRAFALADECERRSIVCSEAGDEAGGVHYGARAAKMEAWAEDERNAGEPERGHYRYFIPNAGGEPVGCSDWRTYAAQDYARAVALARGDWHFVGVIAKAEIRLTEGGPVQVVRSGGLWGVESDSGAEYFAEIEEEQLAELRAELCALGFGAWAVSYAIKRAERVEQ